MDSCVFVLCVQQMLSGGDAAAGSDNSLTNFSVVEDETIAAEQKGNCDRTYVWHATAYDSR